MTKSTKSKVECLRNYNIQLGRFNCWYNISIISATNAFLIFRSSSKRFSNIVASIINIVWNIRFENLFMSSIKDSSKLMHLHTTPFTYSKYMTLFYLDITWLFFSLTLLNISLKKNLFTTKLFILYFFFMH